MIRSLNLFNQIINDTGNTKVIYEYLDSVVHPPFDYTDLLRWQWAQAVSALDKLIHDLVRIGMLEIFMKKRQPTKKYNSFLIDVNAYTQMIQFPTDAATIFEQIVIIKNSFLAFQEPQKISEALSYIWDEEHKWKKIATKLGADDKNTKTELKNIVIRRNQIVHEGDYSDSILNRQEIIKEDVVDVLDFIQRLGVTIYELVSTGCQFHGTQEEELCN